MAQESCHGRGYSSEAGALWLEKTATSFILQGQHFRELRGAGGTPARDLLRYACEKRSLGGKWNRVLPVQPRKRDDFFLHLAEKLRFRWTNNPLNGADRCATHAAHFARNIVYANQPVLPLNWNSFDDIQDLVYDSLWGYPQSMVVRHHNRMMPMRAEEAWDFDQHTHFDPLEEKGTPRQAGPMGWKIDRK